MKAKNILEWLVSLAGVATLALSLSGLTVPAMIAAGISLLLSLIMFVWRLIAAIHAGRKNRILLQFLMLIALACLIAGIGGVSYISVSGYTAQEFDSRVPYMQQFVSPLSGYVTKPKAILTTVMLFLARYRMIFLWVGGALMLLFLGLQIGMLFTERKKRRAEETAAEGQYAPSPEQFYAPEIQQIQGQNRMQPTDPQSVQPLEQLYDDMEKTVLDTQLAIPIAEDHCCICGAALTEGSAALFTDPGGREARIDEACWNRINMVCNGTDPQAITEANMFFYGQLPLVEPPVAEVLQSYVQEGTRRLTQT